MTPQEVIIQFNECINRQDIQGLAELMTNDHVLTIETKAEHSKVEGKEECRKAWEQFFESFPDYKNIFKQVTEKDGVVVAKGRSTCSYKPLDGPAVWTATVEGGKVKGWKVEDIME